MRHDQESGGGNLAADVAEMTRDEVKFSSFINRLRANFKEIIVKPIKLQMLIEFPELKEDESFIKQVDIVFNTNQVFEEWKKLANMDKKASILGTMIGIMNGEKPYFHIDYLMDRVFKLTPEEKEENASYWAKDASGAVGGDDVGASAEGEAPAAEGEAPAADAGAEAPAADAGGESPAADAGGEFEF